MDQMVGGQQKLNILKKEATKALNDMNDRMEFGLASFDASVQWFKESPTTADTAGRGAGIAWVLAIPNSRGTCIGGGTRKALQIAHKSNKPLRTVILVGDGQPSRCEPGGRHSTDQAMQYIRGANTQKLPVNTIFVGTPNQSSGKNFLRKLAAETGGSYTESAG